MNAGQTGIAMDSLRSVKARLEARPYYEALAHFKLSLQDSELAVLTLLTANSGAIL